MAREVLITGSAGRVGRLLRPRLAAPGRTLRLLDLVEQDPPAPGEAVRLIRADLTEPAALASACAGADAIVHLAAIAGEESWENLLRTNVDGTRRVLEAARVAGVPRVVLASSIHATGFYRQAGSTPDPPGVPAPAGPDGVPADAFPRPDTYYGWSKAAVESLGSLYADRFGMTVFVLRMGACFPEPPGLRGLDMWLSPDDCGRLMTACLETDATGFRVLWGFSRNTRRWGSLAEGRRIGYDPHDDAERYADTVRERAGERSTAGLIGAEFCAYPLGEVPNYDD